MVTSFDTRIVAIRSGSAPRLAGGLSNEKLSSQHDWAALIDSGLDRRDIDIRVARSDYDRLRRPGSREAGGGRDSRNQDSM